MRKYNYTHGGSGVSGGMAPQPAPVLDLGPPICNDVNGGMAVTATPYRQTAKTAAKIKPLQPAPVLETARTAATATYLKYNFKKIEK